MINKAVIGISSNLTFENESSFLGYERAYVSQDYVDSVINSGGIPLILPMTNDNEIIKAYVEKIDGLILTGGYDVNPLLYRQDPHKLLQEILPRRDEFEIKLLKEACKQGKPIFGICRGLQLINVGFGGTLHQDISLAPFETIKHNQNVKWNVPTHNINLEGILKDILNKDQCLVNSFHHQIIDELAQGFKAVARSNDGVIESIFFENNDLWILGVQWHPEMMTHNNSDSVKIFNLFIQKSLEKR